MIVSNYISVSLFEKEYMIETIVRHKQPHPFVNNSKELEAQGISSSELSSTDELSIDAPSLLCV